MRKAFRHSFVVLICLASPMPGLVQASDSKPSGWTVDLETGGLWFSRNEARIPSDTGTTVNLRDLTGSDGDTGAAGAGCGGGQSGCRVGAAPRGSSQVTD
jgi:hypothetical protein